MAGDRLEVIKNVVEPAGSGADLALETLHQLRLNGYEFDGATEALQLFRLRHTKEYEPPFTLLEAKVTSLIRPGKSSGSKEAIVRVLFGDQELLTVCEGNGPVNAVDNALRKALRPLHPEIDLIKLSDYKVTIVNSNDATAAKTRVAIEGASTVSDQRWATLGVSEDIVEASVIALCDLYELYLHSSRGATPIQRRSSDQDLPRNTVV